VFHLHFIFVSSRYIVNAMKSRVETVAYSRQYIHRAFIFRITSRRF
jgi:hypothetical protein